VGGEHQHRRGAAAGPQPLAPLHAAEVGQAQPQILQPLQRQGLDAGTMEALLQIASRILYLRDIPIPRCLPSFGKGNYSHFSLPHESDSPPPKHAGIRRPQ
jgi:hypothetical protein